MGPRDRRESVFSYLNGAGTWIGRRRRRQWVASLNCCSFHNSAGTIKIYFTRSFR